MNRIDRVYTHLNKYIFLDDHREMRYLYLMHMKGVAQFAAMIALRRNLNAELLTIAALLHDIHTLDTLESQKHAHKGAVKAREILNGLGIATPEETDIICNAIYNHSDKKNVHGAYDEALKDADVLQHCFYNIDLLPSDKDSQRFYNLLNEFALANPH